MDIDDLIYPQVYEGSVSYDSDEQNLSLNLSFSGQDGPSLNQNIQAAFFEVLSDLFANRDCSTLAWLALSRSQKDLLRESLRRKFVLNELGEARQIKIRRRSEEECKFVVKKGMRSLLKAFKRDHKDLVRGCKSLDEEEFYRFYFAEQASSTGEDLDYFYLPGCKAQKASSLISSLDKTVSAAYLQRVLGSLSFRADFFKYLMQSLQPESVRVRNAKLVKLAAALASGKKCRSVKLPWTEAEVKGAREHLCSVIANMN